MKEVLLAQLDLAQEYFDRSTASLTEEDSAFAPAEGLFTVAQQVAHAAHTIDWFFAGAFDPNGFDMGFEDHDRQIRGMTSLTEARAWLHRALDNGRALVRDKTEAEWSAPIVDGVVMGGMPRTTIFGGITDHTAHHRGALTVYARLLRKTPPNPYM